jgi:hypothetical protein
MLIFLIQNPIYLTKQDLIVSFLITTFVMLKFIFKPFAVMVMAFFAFIFLVSTVIPITSFASDDLQATIILADNSSTKDLILCINNKFAEPKNNQYPVSIGANNIKIFYNKLDKSNCNDSQTPKTKVYELTQNLNTGDVFTLTVTGKAEFSGLIKHNKTVLLGESDLEFDNDVYGVLAWKNVNPTLTPNVSEICVNNKILKESKPGSKQAIVEPGFYRISFEYYSTDTNCTPILPDSEGHSLYLDIGCLDGKMYELATEKDDDYGKASIQGLSVVTKLDVKVKVKTTTPTPITPLPAPKPLPEPALTPIASSPPKVTPAIPVPVISPAVATTRSGGVEIFGTIITFSILGIFGFAALKRVILS